MDVIARDSLSNRMDVMHETETKTKFRRIIHSMPKEENCRRLEDDVVVIE